MSLKPKRVILFVDLLGVRSRWLKGGRDEAEKAFKGFRTLVAASFKNANMDHLEHGLVESDAVALTFSDLQTALAVAKAMFLAAFGRPNRKIWLRGCIVSHGEGDTLRKATTYSGKLSKVELMLYSEGLLEAISVEKSGFKGMRLLVERELITSDVRAVIKQPMGHLNFIPVTKLRDSTYPKRLDDTFMDYLWMGTTDRDEFEELRSVMAVRLRLAANEPEEFIQAAATQVVFHECTAILSSLGGKVHYRGIKQAREDSQKDLNAEPPGGTIA